MANYSKIKRVRPLWSRIAVAVEGNWNLEEQEDIREVEKGIEKLRREAEQDDSRSLSPSTAWQEA